MRNRLSGARSAWYIAFVAVSIVLIGLIYALTGRDALGATARFLWSGAALAFEGLVRIIGSLFGVIVRGLGWRQLSRLSTVIGSIGLGYAVSALFGDKGVRRARNWRERLRAILIKLRDWWLVLPLWGKLAVVFVMITSQVYLHAVLIVFPIAFLVPIVRRIWVQIADLALGRLVLANVRPRASARRVVATAHADRARRRWGRARRPVAISVCVALVAV